MKGNYLTENPRREEILMKTILKYLGRIWTGERKLKTVELVNRIIKKNAKKTK